MKFIFIPEAPKGVVRVMLEQGKESMFVEGADKKRTLKLGIGERKDVTLRKFVVIARQIVASARANRLTEIAVDFGGFHFPGIHIPHEALAEIIATSFEMANFEFVKFKTPPEDGWKFVEKVFVTGKTSAAVRRAFECGALVGREVNMCRVLANTPGGEMTPKVLADAARSAVKGTKATAKILGLSEIKKLKMGGVLGVAQGSDEEPRFIILEYKGGQRSEKPVVLVGKGVTFDTGGLNLKPGDSIYEMHMDMSGGAAVIHAIALAAKLKLKKNVVALVPAVENMPSGSSYRPGDVLKTMSGKTIEVLNTDAEGRVILSDALTFAKRYNPKLVVDVATLTGAAMVALGLRASAIFTKDEKLEHLFRELGEESGDYVWPLPLWDEYEEDIKGTFGDWANTGKARYGGAITGAMFLYQFAKDYPWVHIDIAPRMTSVDGEFLAKGAAGAPVRLLLKLLERF